MTTLKNRKTGAVLGALVGEALGVGPHWYYNLEELRREYGPWISDYTDPKPDRYHGSLKAGQLSQSGILMTHMLQSLVENRGYDHESYCRALDQFLQQLDGEPMSGPGGYTSQSIRDLYRKRVVEGKDWSETGGPADTTEAIERNIPLVVRYFSEPRGLTRHLLRNTSLSQTDETVQSMTLAYSLVLAQLLSGEAMDAAISDRIMATSKAEQLPFHVVTGEGLGPPVPGTGEPSRFGKFASPDALLSPSYMVRAAQDPDIVIEPAWKVSLVYGMPCAIYHQLPAAYYLAARFSQDFEAAVLHAVNGGGQNQARAMLTGALVGAQTGLDGIPRRFLEGLEEAERWIDWAEQL